MILNKAVEKAIELLRSAPFRVRVGGHEADSDNSASCPIASGYHVNAVFPWSKVSQKDQNILRKYGWTSTLYNAFISWYDGNGGHEVLDSESELRKLLRQKIKKEIRHESRKRRHRRQKHMVTA